VQTKFINGDKPEDFKAAIDEKTKAIYVSLDRHCIVSDG
jgi:O-acetylhomoserine/O-acetylserine sulfhydrylase